MGWVAGGGKFINHPSHLPKLTNWAFRAVPAKSPRSAAVTPRTRRREEEAQAPQLPPNSEFPSSAGRGLRVSGFCKEKKKKTF